MARSDPKFLDLCAKRWPNKLARLRGGFYKIKTKDGNVIPFTMNADQEEFFGNRHGFDVLLKARQKGFTTLIQLDMLDDCLFIPNTASGIVAHNREDAEAFFSDKIRFAYDELPPEFRAIVSAEQDTAKSLKFSNGSAIRVGTSLRSGTFQRLHVSEYGKLCAKYPEKAREVKSGAFNTVQAGERITVESTAEGRSGDFFEMCRKAQNKAKLGTELTPLDFKFHFSPWWTSPEYRLSQTVPEPAEFQEYFAKLRDLGIELTSQQRAWYVKKADEQGEDMKREYPSTPEEAFEASMEGAYLSKQMAKMRVEKRICRIPTLEIPVDTSWDLGVNDSTAITFWQTVGMERRAIDYYENSGEGWGHYAKVLGERNYNYRRHYLPHDADSRRMGIVAETGRELAEQAGIRPTEIVGRIAEDRDGVEASRSFLAQVWIDEERCSRLIECLDSFRKEWDDRLGVWKDHYRHDEFSHGYKSLETYAVGNPMSPIMVARPMKRNTKWVV